MKLTKVECSNKQIEKKWNEAASSLILNDKEEPLPKISVNIMVKNEERCIERCLRSVADFADEIIIVDTGSTDQTLEIIQSFDSSLRVFQKEWHDDFAEIRNFMIEVSSHDWIFQLDADETLVNEFTGLKTLLSMCDADKNNHFYFINPRIENSNGLIYVLTRRIFKKHPRNRYVGIIHEEMRVHSHKEEQTVDFLIDGTILHDGYEREIIQQKHKNSRNVRALEVMTAKEPNNPRWTYFLARDVYNGLEKLSDYNVDDVKKMLSKTTEMTACQPELGFIEAAYVLLEEILVQEESWEELQLWIQALKKRFPQNADSYYFELIMNQNSISGSQERFLNDLFQKLKHKDATSSKIDENLSHILYAFASSHYQNGNIQRAALFLEELPSDKQQLFIESHQKQLTTLQQILKTNP